MLSVDCKFPVDSRPMNMDGLRYCSGESKGELTCGCWDTGETNGSHTL